VLIAHSAIQAISVVFPTPWPEATRSALRIPMKPARHSKMMPATRSETKPATVPI
jgi:hypothetical protein